MYSITMKQAIVTITADLEDAIESYRRDLGIPPGIDVAVEWVLREHLIERGYLVEGPDELIVREEAFLIPSSGGKPAGLKDAPVLDEENSVSRAVIEDRR